MDHGALEAWRGMAQPEPVNDSEMAPDDEENLRYLAKALGGRVR